jgi:hypothetical protein
LSGNPGNSSGMLLSFHVLLRLLPRYSLLLMPLLLRLRLALLLRLP